MSITIEQSLGAYNILSRLSVGGMGEVYLAEDTRLHRKVALKVLPQEWGSDSERLERFQWEARVLATLNHPNIVTIYSVEEEGGVHFFTMELVEGQTLREIIPPGLPLDRFLELAIPLADALAAAHQRGIIHRDIKPGNIMVRPDDRLKMLDFGLAKREPGDNTTAVSETDELRGPEPQTQDGRLLGTLAYMSPEQLAGRPIDHRADLYSLGVVFFELLTEVRPRDDPSWASKITTHLLEKRSPAAPPDAQLPQRLEEIVHRCLEIDPAQRYQTAVELREDLTELQLEIVSGSFSSTQITRPEFARPKRVWPAVLAGVLLVVMAVAAVLVVPRFFTGDAKITELPQVEQKTITVLPFQNLGSPDEADFAAGITEEIISRLASVSALKVVRASRVDAMPRELAGELGVDYLLEGSVLWSSEGGQPRVRVIPKLTQVSDGTHLRLTRYDRVLVDALEVQAEIAEQVILQLNIRLQGTEQERLSVLHTRNPQAYEAYLRGMARNAEAFQAYLRGMEYASRHVPNRKNWMLAVDMLGRAVRLDPEFAPAHAELSKVHSFFYHQSMDRTAKRLDMAHESAERALRIAPHLPDGHRAMGYYYYWGLGDYDRALEQFHTAVQLLPNDPQLHEGIGYIRRRQGRFKEALQSFETAMELNPKSNWLMTEMAHTYTNLRLYQKADEHYDRAIGIAPDQSHPYQLKALNVLRWTGDIKKAQTILSEMPGRSETGSIYNRFKVEYIARNYQKALLILSSIKTDLVGIESALFPKEMSRGGAYSQLGDLDQATVHFQAARRTLEKKIADRPDDPRLRSSLGLTYAGLTHVGLDFKQQAIREGKKAIELYPMTKDAFVGPDYLGHLAVIYAWSGEPDLAIDLVEKILVMPSGLSKPYLRIHPRWDALRGHPRFEELLARP